MGNGISFPVVTYSGFARLDASLVDVFPPITYAECRSNIDPRDDAPWAISYDAGTQDCFIYVYPPAPAAGAVVVDALGTIAYPSNCPNAAIGDVPDVNGVCYTSTLLGASCTIPTGSTDCETLTTGFVCGTNGLADVCQFPGEGGTCVPIAQGGDLTCLSQFGCDPLTNSCQRSVIGAYCSFFTLEETRCTEGTECVPGGNDFFGGTCQAIVLPPTARARSRVRQAKLKAKRALAQYCEVGETACALGSGSAYECVDLDNELENCGECGKDCTAIPGAQSVGCAEGSCYVAACAPGLVLSGNERCVAA